MIAGLEMVDRDGHKGKVLMSAAWHGAAFTRAKRMPPLARVLNAEGKVKDHDDLLAKMKTAFGAKWKDG